MSRKIQAPELLTPEEVSRLFRVDPRTVARWAKQRKLRAIRTLGGHRRFFAAEVNALLNGAPLTDAELARLTGGSNGS